MLVDRQLFVFLVFLAFPAPTCFAVQANDTIAALEGGLDSMLAKPNLPADATKLLQAIKEDVQFLNRFQKDTRFPISKAYEQILRDHTSALMSLPIQSMKKYHLDLLSDLSIDFRLKVEYAKHGSNTVATKTNGGPLYNLSLSNDQKFILTSNDDNRIVGWDVEKDLLVKFGGSENHGRVISMATLPKGKFVVGSPEGHITLYSDDKAEKGVEWRIGKEKKPHYSLDFSAQGLMSVGTHDGSVQLWDVHSQKLIRKVSLSSRPISSVGFSPDGLWICATEPGRGLYVWNTTGGLEKKTLTTGPNESSVIAFAPQQTLLASVSREEGEVTLWNWMDEKAKPTKFASRQKSVWSAAFSPDGKMLATGGSSLDGSGEMKLWSLEKKDDVKTLRYPSVVCNVRFTADGKIATTHGDGSIRLYSIGAPVLNPFDPIAVTAETLQGKNAIDGYTVWYVPKAYRGHESSYKPFATLSSPARHAVPAGNYVVWANKEKATTGKNTYTIDSKSPSTFQLSVP